MNKASIVVLTPIRNEEWILQPFLQATSVFADHIIVADQKSTDRSREICARYPKVSLIDNPSRNYHELERQRLLIEFARRHLKGTKILLALDADEICAADSLQSPDWEEIRRLRPGVTLTFPKPDLVFSRHVCRDSKTPFPLGYSDDGRAHDGLLIHSTRIPAGPDIPQLEIRGIRFLHLAMLREHEFFARQRLYSVIENVNRTKSIAQRLSYYSPSINRRRILAASSPTPRAWFESWSRHGVTLDQVQTKEANHFAGQVLEHFAAQGERRFYLDDIWDVSWEAIRTQLATAWPVALKPVTGPTAAHRLAVAFMRKLRSWRDPR